MHIKEYIKVFDQCISVENISSILKFASKKCEFHDGLVIGSEKTRKDIRDTQIYNFTLDKKELTGIHWFNYLNSIFLDVIKQYHFELGTIERLSYKITDISLLKYQEKGHYTWHTDNDSKEFPRTLSMILQLNNDYEGGNLCFRNQDGTEEWCIDTVPGRVIIWPSNFLYPHTVKPVTKGTRYSIVSWAS